MKYMKRLLAAVLTILMGVSVSIPASSANSGRDHLQFNSLGKFRIMIFTDAHDDDTLAETTRLLMCEALDRYHPDFVVFLGDNTTVSGYDRQVAAIDALTKPTRERGIPFGMVHGNHDSEYGMSREEICEIWNSFGCMTYDADPSLYGCGTCNLPIYASDGSKIAFNLWFIDSGSNNTDPGAQGYDYVHPDQIEWYKKTAAALAAQNGGEVVPAIDFQHIIIPEIYDKLYVNAPVEVEGLTTNTLGRTVWQVPILTRLNGYWLEHPCPPDVYDGQFAAWKEVGDVIAEFNGHDHKNTFQVNVDGIDIVNVPACGEAAYHSDFTRGIGLITLDEKHPRSYDYQLVQMYKLALFKDSQIPNAEGGKSRAEYAGIALVDSIPQLFFQICRFFNKMGAMLFK